MKERDLVPVYVNRTRYVVQDGYLRWVGATYEGEPGFLVERTIWTTDNDERPDSE